MKEILPPPSEPSELSESPVGDGDVRELQEKVQRLKNENEGLMGLTEKLSARLQEEHHTATHDPLTGVFNREGLAKRFTDIRHHQTGEEEGANAARSEKNDRRAHGAEGNPAPVTLLFVDIDKFKGINDTYGHPVGDAAIKAAANYLKEQFHRNDDVVSHFVSRLGGDEFVVVLQNTTPEVLMKRIKGKLGFTFVAGQEQEQEGTQDGAQETISVNLSGGLIRLKTGESLERALARADEALYLSKQAGGNEINIFEEATGKEEQAESFRAD